MSVLVGDIGGTNTRLLWSDGSTTRRGAFLNAGFADLYQVIAQFLEQFLPGAETRLQRLVLALPAPLEQHPVRLTNIDWWVDRAALAQRFGVDEVLLVNDFQAAAVGAVSTAVDSDERLVVHPAATTDSGVAVVTGAGTGLGMAWIADCGRADFLPQATEGGHTDFAPTDAEQCELLRWLLGEYRHVSYERLLSGPGLAAIYRFLADGREKTPDQISASASSDPLAERAIRLFMRIFGAYVGNLALLFKPTAGIHLCGGVSVSLADWFKEDFLEAYLEKGRMRSLVEQFGVSLVTRPDLGVTGCLALAERHAPTPPAVSIQYPPNA